MAKKQKKEFLWVAHDTVFPITDSILDGRVHRSKREAASHAANMNRYMGDRSFRVVRVEIKEIKR